MPHKNTLSVDEKERAVLDRIDRAEKLGSPITMQMLRQRMAGNYSERDLRRVVQRLSERRLIHGRARRPYGPTLHIGAPQ